ncbi:MAG TPA: hypothetical protein VFV46_00995 [Lacibacter sp.]|nr:hypothetical protein [Lacibacter sp.]
MQKSFWSFVLIYLFTIGSCSDKPSKEKAGFMDVAGYLKGQLAYLDTVPLALLKTTLQDTVYTDSVFIQKAQLRTAITPYLQSQLDKEQFESSFEETSFLDASINTVTLTYNAINNNLPIQRIDVYVDPETEQIKRVYLVRQELKKDTSVSQQLLWRHNSGCTFITTYQTKQQEFTTNEKISWNE